jgi:hypothetical protein
VRVFNGRMSSSFASMQQLAASDRAAAAVANQMEAYFPRLCQRADALGSQSQLQRELLLICI